MQFASHYVRDKLPEYTCRETMRRVLNNIRLVVGRPVFLLRFTVVVQVCKELRPWHARLRKDKATVNATSQLRALIAGQSLRQ